MHPGPRLALIASLLGLCVAGTPTAGAQQATESSLSTRPCDALDVRSDERPRKEGGPTEVTVGVRLVDVTHIDDVSQSINADFVVRQTWTDSRLIPFAGCKFRLDQVWTPHIDMVNSGHLWTRLRSYVEVRPFGRVQYMQRYHGAVTFPYQAHRFPFDKHEIALSFLPLEYEEDQVVLANDEKFTGRTSMAFNIADWTIGRLRRSSSPCTSRPTSASIRASTSRWRPSGGPAISFGRSWFR